MPPARRRGINGLHALSSRRAHSFAINKNIWSFIPNCSWLLNAEAYFTHSRRMKKLRITSPQRRRHHEAVQSAGDKDSTRVVILRYGSIRAETIDAIG